MKLLFQHHRLEHGCLLMLSFKEGLPTLYISDKNVYVGNKCVIG